MTPRPVLLLIRELGLGGSERQAAEIARALDRNRFEPHVGCFRPGGFRAAELAAAGVPVVVFPVRSFGSPSVLRGAALFGGFVRRKRIQLVHSFDYPMNLFGVPAARAFGVPRVLSSQRAHRELTPGIARHLLRVTDQMVDAVVVNCDSVRRQLIACEKVPPSRIRLCYNGLDTRVFRPGPGARPEALREACVIGVVCALRPEKNLEVLLQAFATVMRPGLKLAVVGSGPRRDALMALAAKLAIDAHFEPATGRVADWLRAIDIFVLPSTTEALSNSLMEAMACGCCAVASQVGGNPELIDHGRTGLLFRGGDAGSLAACLRLVLDNDALRLRLAEAGSERIRREFSLEASARRMAEIYEGELTS
jgi:glycosyltransferase involved in cell wall biosynthesis